MPEVIARIALAVAALCVAVFLALELEAETRLQAGRSQAYAQRSPSPEVRTRALADLRSGEALHPGTDASLAMSLLELRAGQGRAAERLARRALAREPNNWEAWKALAASLQGRDDAAAGRAVRRARLLNPLAR